MSRIRTDPDHVLLDLEAWEVPARLSDEDLYTHAGADRRHDGHAAVSDPEDDR